MPSYEAALILRQMTRPETASVLKRIATKIFDNNGILFGIDNLGSRALPFRMKKLDNVYHEGSYFVFKFDSNPKAIAVIQDECQRDVDIINGGIKCYREQEKYDCTLEQELLPPAYRQDIKEMIETGRKKETHWESNTGLDYNPFTR